MKVYGFIYLMELIKYFKGFMVVIHFRKTYDEKLRDKIKANRNFETTNYKEITKTSLYKVPHNR